MSLSYRTRRENPKSLPRLNNNDRLTKDYEVKQSAYESLHQELSNRPDVKLHDTYLTEDSDNKIVELTYLREELNHLAELLTPE